MTYDRLIEIYSRDDILNNILGNFQKGNSKD